MDTDELNKLIRSLNQGAASDRREAGAPELELRSNADWAEIASPPPAFSSEPFTRTTGEAPGTRRRSP